MNAYKVRDNVNHDAILKSENDINAEFSNNIFERAESVLVNDENQNNSVVLSVSEVVNSDREIGESIASNESAVVRRRSSRIPKPKQVTSININNFLNSSIAQ